LALFGNIQGLVQTLAKHLDIHVMETLGQDCGSYQSLAELTSQSKLVTARSFYYRERTILDDYKQPSFNFHYDRMNVSASVKDFYYMLGVEIE